MQSAEQLTKLSTDTKNSALLDVLGRGENYKIQKLLSYMQMM